MQFTKLFKNNNIFSFIVLLSYLILCLLMSLSRVPFYDEAHAYTISQLPINEIFQLTKVEGHCVLWYILLKIFCPNINFYPYNILFFNWVIYCFLTLFFWFKSPFNFWVKLLILLSFPFMHYFAIVARPYGLCVFALFILTYLYLNNPNKKPYWFGFCLFLCSQLSFISTIGSGVFFLFYLYDSIKLKKIKEKSFIIITLFFSLSIMLFLLQVFNLNIEQMRNTEDLIELYDNFSKFIYRPFFINENTNYIQILFRLIGTILFYLVPFTFFKKNKTSFLFIILNAFIMSFFFFNIYIGSAWHYFFYFIYLIIAYWIGYNDFKNCKILNSFLITFVFTFITPYSISTQGAGFFETNGMYYKIMINEVLKLDLKNSKLFCLDYYSPFSAGTLPYLTQRNINVFDMQGNPLNSLESLKMTFKYRNMPLDFEKFVSNLDKTKKNYLINQATNLEARCLDSTKLKILKNIGFTYTQDNITLKFIAKTYLANYAFTIYEIEVLENEK